MNKVTLSRVLWRSFFLQASWNYRGQQNLGFSSSIQPALEEIHGTESDEARQAFSRSLVSFNTQPYMSGPILGALIRAEENGASGGLLPEKMMRFRSAMTSAFAAIGDAFFWNALLPAAAVIGLFGAFERQIWGAGVFLVFFNIPHLVLRIWGFWKGYEQGLDVFRVLDRFRLPGMAIRLRLFTSGALGILAAWALLRAAGDSWSLPEFLAVGVLTGPLIYGGSRLMVRRIPIEVFIYGVLAISSVFCYLVG